MKKIVWIPNTGTYNLSIHLQVVLLHAWYQCSSADVLGNTVYYLRCCSLCFHNSHLVYRITPPVPHFLHQQVAAPSYSLQQHRHHSSSKLDEIHSFAKLCIRIIHIYICTVLVRQDVRFPVMSRRRRDIAALWPEEPSYKSNKYRLLSWDSHTFSEPFLEA